MIYHTCSHCGAHLDPGEKCDCQDTKSNRKFEEKRGFITRLKLLLLEADVDLSDLQLIDADTVEASFIGGGKRRINIAADSRSAIIKDVMKHII